MSRRGTYSIVARDPQTGELGVAVQSHWFSVGSVVAWARAGTGAVATQAFAEPAYGPRLLERLAGGERAGDALQALLAEDEQADHRQVAVVAAQGAPTVHTGGGCIAFAGDVAGEDFTAQANMMAAQGVPEAMAQAYRAAGGPLARRLVAALRGAEAAGGDVRGRQSSCLLVVPASGEPWQRTVDLRVEDHADPLGELERLLTLHDAYRLATEGDDLTGQGRHDEAGRRYRQAAALAPDNDELLFWSGLSAAQAGDLAAGAEQVRQAIARHAGWRDLLDRLSPDVAPSAAAVREALR